MYKTIQNSKSFNKRRYPHLSNQAGLTLLEVIISLSIIATATIGLNSIADRFSDDTKNTVTASQVRTFGEAAKAYIKDNYTAVQGVATATTPALINVATLIAGGQLTAGFVAKNGFGQSMCALVLEPAANRLQAMVITESGTAIDDLSMGSIASVIGGSGGGVYSSDTSIIRGAMGGWSIPTATFDNLANNVGKRCDGTTGNVRLLAGHPAMALWFENGDTSSAFLARDAIPGRPELNAMNTPLVMNSVQAVDVACTRLGAIARDTSGAVLSCNGGKWKTQGSAFWEDPVTNYAALPACAAAIAGQTRVVATPTTGTGPRAHTCDGAAWKALAVDNTGNLTLPGTLSTGKVQVNDVVTEGSACGANGLVAKDSTGLLLSCQSGLWSKQGSNSCSAWSGDLNWLEGTAGQPGCINGSGLGNAPTADWFFVEYNRHTNPANYYVSQRAVGMTGSAAGKTWIRSQQSGSAGSGWGSWAELTSGYGQYAFAVTGYGGAFIGIGTKNPDGTFTGSVICNPYTVSVECGKGGNYYCGADAACALTRAYSGGGYTSGQNVVGAAYLPIYNVVKYSGP